MAGVFVLGIGTGVTVDSAINTDPRDLASRDAIDRNAPNPNICQTYGSSAMVVDQRVFVTFNPFSLHVSQVRISPEGMDVHHRVKHVIGRIERERRGWGGGMEGVDEQVELPVTRDRNLEQQRMLEAPFLHDKQGLRVRWT